MKQTVYVGDFRDAFRNMGRENQFSYEGLGMLFDYFEELEESCGHEMELDVIAICCDFSEEHWSDIAENYEIEIIVDDDEASLERVLEHLEQNTSVVGVTDKGDIIYQNY